MTAKKRAALVAERLRAAAVAPIAATVGDEITLKQATPRAHAAPLPTWDVPHVAGRLDARRRISLHALHDCPDTDFFDVSFNGPWIVLTPATSRSPRGRCGLEDRQRNGSSHRRLRLSVAVTERLHLGTGDAVLVLADIQGGRLVVSSPTVLAAAAMACQVESAS